MMWNAMRGEIETRGGTVRTDSEVVAIGRDGNRLSHVVVARNGTRETVRGTRFLSSMPITELVARLDPPAPDRGARGGTAALLPRLLDRVLDLRCPRPLPRQLDLHPRSEVQVGRIQNFKNWSPEMVPDAGKTSLGLEYFCTEGDALWTMRDEDLIELAKREVATIGLARVEDCIDGCVRRVPKAYPVYDSAYREHLDVVRGYVAGLENLETIGRNGLHRYNNQDHAMVTGMLAVRNLVDGEHNDIWAVNTDDEYHEEVRSAVPDVDEETVTEEIVRIFAKLDRWAFGAALGIVMGSVLFVATLILALKGGDVVGPHLALLAQYFPGYRVSVGGSLLGLVYGSLQASSWDGSSRSFAMRASSRTSS
jgi:hypothetical protein